MVAQSAATLKPCAIPYINDDGYPCNEFEGGDLSFAVVMMK
jgi:hypothetical protein